MSNEHEEINITQQHGPHGVIESFQLYEMELYIGYPRSCINNDDNDFP